MQLYVVYRSLSAHTSLRTHARIHAIQAHTHYTVQCAWALQWMRVCVQVIV